jgi:hypothetical protein
MNLRLSAPKVVTFWIAVVIVVLGILVEQGVIGGLPIAPFWVVVIGFVLLALANLLRDL